MITNGDRILASRCLSSLDEQEAELLLLALYEPNREDLCPVSMANGIHRETKGQEMIDQLHSILNVREKYVVI